MRSNCPREPEPYSPQRWEHPEAQALFGAALVKAGRKHQDMGMIRLGWMHQRRAREQYPGQPQEMGEEGMKLPENCPHARTLWRQMLSAAPRQSASSDAILCCRADGRVDILGDKEPLCLTMGCEAEVYRFVWRSSFDGDAVVRIGRQDRAITLRWRYDWFRRPTPNDAPAEAALSPGDWARFLDALIATNFWALDPADEPLRGLDGAEWLIEGRRSNIYRGVSRWSPRGEVHALGRLFFDLAGPPLSKVELY